jgi:hypothetical protein
MLFGMSVGIAFAMPFAIFSTPSRHSARHARATRLLHVGLFACWVSVHDHVNAINEHEPRSSADLAQGYACRLLPLSILPRSRTGQAPPTLNRAGVGEHR